MGREYSRQAADFQQNFEPSSEPDIDKRAAAKL
jgi:hypothetical protein